MQRAPQAVARALDANKQSQEHWSNVHSIMDRVNNLTTDDEKDATQLLPSELSERVDSSATRDSSVFADLDNDTRKQLFDRQGRRVLELVAEHAGHAHHEVSLLGTVRGHRG